MSWFLFSLICVFGWGCADLFYKIGSDVRESNTHLRIAVWVGFVMGVVAVLLLPFSESGLTVATIPEKALAYAPASLGYIISMVIGYAGLRYLELSIVSPIQNASGALTVAAMSVFYLLTGHPEKIADSFGALEITGTVLIVAGTVALAAAEQKISRRVQTEEIRKTAREGLSFAAVQNGSGAEAGSENREPFRPEPDRNYTTGALALLFPILYCVFDTIGTAADGIILDTDSGLGLGEFDVLILYGLTFFAAGLVCFFVLWGKEKHPYRMFAKDQWPKAAAAVCEQFGQIFYVFAMAEKPLLAAPMVASYCILSVILSRVFLKERPERSQLCCVLAVIAGIVLLGISEGLAA